MIVPMVSITLNKLMKSYVYEFWIFGLKQANAAIFGGFLLAIMIITKYYYPLEFLHRYDFIFISAILFQTILILLKLETKQEALVIIIFHFIATLMELFKTSDAIGSWYYPEEYTFGIMNVPLFTGFMYSAVGSYLARVWRIFEFEFTDYPQLKYTITLVTLIYINFFSHHYVWDMRWILLIFTFLLFRKTKIHFKIIKTHRNMFLLLGWFLVSLFIWFAENIATYANIWIYPNQQAEWQIVPIAKLTSWYLLMMLSFVLITCIRKIHLRN